jgi:hypothetical protein
MRRVSKPAFQLTWNRNGLMIIDSPRMWTTTSRRRRLLSRPLCAGAQDGDAEFTRSGGPLQRRLRPVRAAADQDGMTSSASPTATWLPAAMVRAAVVHSTAAAPARGRHRAPESESGAPEATEEQQLRVGRHAEPEEQDSLDWLGFTLR